MILFEEPEKAVRGSSAILIITEWDIFRTYPYDLFYKIMEKPSHIFDGRNLLNEEKLN
jgi:UDPglucose 6-dehydrogenase